MMNRRNALLATAATLAAGGSWSQDDRTPVRLIVGLAPGGTLDIVARTLAEKLQGTLGRPVVVENKLGAGQRVALNEVRRAAADGRTLYVGSTSPFSVFPHVYSKLDYDPVKDFTPIARIVQFDNGIATGPGTSAADVKQLVAWLKANPNAAAYGTPGAGTLPHFLGVAVGQSIGVPLTHVPYKGSTPALTDLVGGRLPLLITSLSDLMELHRAGKIRVVAVTGDRRSALVPDAPTLREAGMPISGANTVAMYGPAKMPAEVVRQLHDAIAKAVAAPDVGARFATYGLVPALTSPDELRGVQADELQRFEPLVKASGYKGE